MDRNELLNLCHQGKLERLHTALSRGYLSRKCDGLTLPYKGKFGTGYALYTPNWDSTRYHYITYFVVTDQTTQGKKGEGDTK